MTSNKSEHLIYPFTALVGQERVKAALLVGAVDPSIGGVLIRGEKGTGKTTMVRALAELLPPISVVRDCPYNCRPDDEHTLHDECREKIAAGTVTAATLPTPLVELPLNATEERLAGAIHLEETLRTGRRHFEPGLLAAANRGILYIDEVNLLEDHLVDLILDAAATGVNRVEREGFSLKHAASFLLVGTMNPEEGELRPQFLDRFGLCVTIRGAADPGQRKEIALRRLRFEADPKSFVREAGRTQHEMRRMILQARELFSSIEPSEEIWDLIVDLASRAGVQGHRADIVIAKTARAFAALNSRRRILREDVFEAARLALSHRLSGSLDSSPENNQEALDRLIGGSELSDMEAEEAGGSSSEGEEFDTMQVPGSAAAGSIVFDFLKKKSPA
ncbi:MAG TPA: magnesium chelatase [Sediminispirochaeta sp.]|nr:magnesium chelatase [Sediminispirochaeta sp.]